MLQLAALFLIIALIAGGLGITGAGAVVAISMEIAWTLFVLFIVLFLVSLVLGGLRGTGPPA